MNNIVNINNLDNYNIKFVSDDTFFIGKAFKNEKGFFTKKNMNCSYIGVRGKINFSINKDKNSLIENNLYLIEVIKKKHKCNLSKFNELIYVNFDKSLLNDDFIKQIILQDDNEYNKQVRIYETEKKIQHFHINNNNINYFYIPVLKDNIILFLSVYQFGIFEEWFVNKNYIYGTHDKYTKGTKFENMDENSIIEYFNKKDFLKNIFNILSFDIKYISGYLMEKDYKILTDDDVSLINDMIDDRILSLAKLIIGNQQYIFIQFNYSIDIISLFNNYTIEELYRVDEIINNIIKTFSISFIKAKSR